METCADPEDSQCSANMDDQTPSAPLLEDDPSLAHKLENLKMAQVKTGKGSTDSSTDEWTVVYSDSNSSAFSSNDEDDDDKVIENSAVGEIIMKREKDAIDSEEEKETLDDLLVDPEDIDHEAFLDEFDNDIAPHHKMALEKLPEIKLTEPGTWERSLAPAWFTPIMDSSSEVQHQEDSPASFADNEYESDIDIINEDELESAMLNGDDGDSILSLSISSVISQQSNLSLLREQYRLAHFMKQANSANQRVPFQFLCKESASEVPSDDESNIDQPVESTLSNKDRIRAYVHTPNTGLNGKLTLLLILTVATVVGLGIGHFIGWSNHWRQHKQLSMGQVIKLKQLQDDLLICMHNQDMVNAIDAESTGQVLPDQFKVCLRDSDYWKERFETLFNENNGLMELFQKTQKHFHEHGDRQNVIEEHECVNKTTSDEFHKLKLDLLVNQMEHVKLLEVLEVVKNMGEQNVLKVKVLEEQNEDLKKKLVEEELDDQQLEETWGSRVALLQNENEELRKTIVDDDAEDMKVLSALKGKIDLVQLENQELRNIINQLEKQMIGVTVDSKSSPSTNSNYQEDIYGYNIRYYALRDRINQMMTENEELKAKVAHYRWTSSYYNNRHHKREDGEDEENDTHKQDDHNERKQEKFHDQKRGDKNERKPSGEDYDKDKKMAILKTKIGILHHQLQIEQSEKKRWKERAQSILRKMYKSNGKGKRQQNQKNRKERDDFSSDDDDYEDDSLPKHTDKEHKGHERYRSKWTSFHKWNTKFESISNRSRKLFSSFYENMRTKWNKFHKKYIKESSEENSARAGTFSINGDKLIKIGQFLESAVDQVQNFSETLFNKGMHSEVVTYLSDRMTHLASLVEKNLNFNQGKSSRPKAQQQTQGKDTVSDAEEKEPSFVPKPPVNNQAKDTEKVSFASSTENEHSLKHTYGEYFDDSDDDEQYSEDTESSEESSTNGPRQTPPSPRFLYSNKGKRFLSKYGSEEDLRNWMAERAKAREKYRRLRYQANFMN